MFPSQQHTHFEAVNIKLNNHDHTPMQMKAMETKFNCNLKKVQTEHLHRLEELEKRQLNKREATLEKQLSDKQIEVEVLRVQLERNDEEHKAQFSRVKDDLKREQEKTSRLQREINDKRKEGAGIITQGAKNLWKKFF